MAQVDVIRNGIIDKLLAITDKDYLSALQKLVDNNPSISGKIKFTNEQKAMLQLSENDILNNNLISQEELDKADNQWLNQQ